MVAVTYTLNTNFGSGIVADGTGILLNNEMDDFSAKPGVPNAYGLVGGAANAVARRQMPAVVHDAHPGAQRRSSPGWSPAAPAARASSPPCCSKSSMASTLA